MPDLLVKLYALPPQEPVLARLAGANIIVRRALPLEKRRIVNWMAAQPDFAEPWLSECEVAFSRQPVGCFIAVQSSQEAATGYELAPETLLGVACYDATARGFFGPEGVRADARGRGIGAALLVRCLHAMRDEGYGYAIIGWAGPVDFYRRTVGAIPIEGSEPGIYRGPLV